MLWTTAPTDIVKLESFKDIRNYLKAKVKTYRGLEVVDFKFNPGLAIWASVRSKAWHTPRRLYFGLIENVVIAIQQGRFEETPAVANPIEEAL